jgi:short-subunit dehydrogenase
MINREQKTGYDLALITGASSGIGAVTAKKLAAEGMRVVLVARRKDRLDQVAEEIRANSGRAETFAADLTQPAGRQATIDFVRSLGELDVLINNAGFGWHGWFDEMSWELAEELLHINIDAGVHLTSEFLPEMLARRRGHIIFLGSIAGDIPSRGIGVYSGTKSFVNGFVTGLYRETRRSGVHISIVKPGAVQSEFFQVGLDKPSGTHIPAAGLGIRTERVTKAVWSLIRRPRRAVYVPGMLVLAQWFALLFGWIMDFIGPVFMPPRSKQ